MKRIAAAAALALLGACGGPPRNNAASAAPANDAGVAVPANYTATASQANVAAWLPAPGPHPAQAMALAVPPEAEALAARMTAAIRANPAWYRSYAAQHPQGELPYHSNLGISADEYRRFLALANRIALREIGRVTLTVNRRADGGLALAADGPAAALNGVIVYPERDGVETPFGRLGNRAPAANRQASSPTGPWEGVRWSNLGSGAPRRVALSFGRRARGDMLIFYDYGPTDAETVVLLYPAAPAAVAR
jgi:hypothetical protein